MATFRFNRYAERKTTSMSGRLPSAGSFCHCYCGSAGERRERRGLKHARVTALRRQGKREMARQIEGGLT
jgi:hypothetical protein